MYGFSHDAIPLPVEMYLVGFHGCVPLQIRYHIEFNRYLQFFRKLLIIIPGRRKYAELGTATNTTWARATLTRAIMLLRFASVVAAGILRKTSLPPWHNTTSVGLILLRTFFRRTNPFADTSPGTPDRITLWPLRDSSTAG